MEDDFSSFESFLKLLDRVMTKMSSLHTLPADFDTGVPLYRAEIHTVQAIGELRETTVTELAEHMNVTKGAVSQIVKKLAAKGLVLRKGRRGDARESILTLSVVGLRGYNCHREFHQQMFRLVKEHFGDRYDEKIRLFTSVMEDMENILAHEQELKCS
jgi:DNA-binding MarR family transcriptional regulator